MDSARGLPKGRGFPIRTSADQRSLASPRGFSQRATSFIASRRQGIHRTPLSRSGQANARKHRNKRRRPRAGPSLAGRATNGGGRHPPRTTTRPRRAHTQYTQSLFTCERTPAAPAPRGRRNNGHGFGGKTGGDRVRTDDPLLAKQVLSRLSYAPAATAKRAGDGTGHERDGPGRT